MALKFYNTLTRKKEVFKPLRKDRVGLYTCGPTVYNYAHIGNLRTYIFEDILRRTLEYAGFKVRHVMNITDVEDKIIRDAKKEGKNIFEFVKPYEVGFYADLAKLDIKKAWKYPKATRHIPAMIKIISALLEKGLAYKVDDSVYFAIAKFRPYGKLSRLSSRKLKAGARIDTDEYAKNDVQDFVLWKGKKPGEPFWPAPFGKGRPGWHIECSAMSMQYLGPTFDIHGGAVDLIFPHHENEIAQSEGATSKKFVNYFMEGEHLLVDGQKMAKSLENFYTLRDLEQKDFNPLAFRHLVLTSHYRSKLNFTWESIAASQNSLDHLYEFVKRLAAQNQKSKIKNQKLDEYKKQFKMAVFNDLDTPKALAVVWNLIHQYNKTPNRYNPKAILKLLYDFDKILGLGLKKVKPEKISAKILELVKKREEYRKAENWSEADRIRKKVEVRGYLVEDGSEGPQVKKL